MGKWSGWSLVRCDVMQAEAALSLNGAVDARMWAALVWKWTTIETGLEAYEGERLFGLVVDRDPHSEARLVRYLSPSQIARQNGPWVRAVGAERMKTWVRLLEDARTLQTAWNALHGQDTDYDPNESAEELRRYRTAAIRERMGGVAKHLTLISMEGE